MLYRIVVSICILTFVAIGKVDAADFGGDQAVLKILKESTESPYTVMNEESQEPQRLLRKYMRKRKWKDSYTSGKFRIFQIGTYSFPSRNPARDRSFVRKRSIAATMAQLNAKIKIIEGIRTTMSASDQFTMPGSPIQKKLNGKKQDLDNKFDDINDRLVKALEKADKAESARLEGADWNDRAEAFADALIKKLNASYNKKQIEGEKLEKAVEMNKKLEELKRLKKDLLEEADKLRNSVKNQTQSSVSSLAEMPLYGIMVLATEESWEPENGNYEVAVLTVWSQKHEMFTRALLTGQHKLPISGDNGELIDWLDGQKFANMIGGQNFTDSKGIRWIIGTAMSELRGNNKKEAVLTAELLSKKEVAMALFSEIRSEKIYKNASKELVTDALKQTTEMKVEESLEVQNRQSFKDRDVSGVFVIDGKVIRHPFTKKKIYVAVSATSTLSQQAAYEIERINYQTNIEDISNQQRQKGVKVGLEKVRQDVKKDKSSFNAGVRAGAGSLEKVNPNSRRSAGSSSGSRRNSNGGGTSSPYSGGSRSRVKENDF